MGSLRPRMRIAAGSSAEMARALTRLARRTRTPPMMRSPGPDEGGSLASDARARRTGSAPPAAAVGSDLRPLRGAASRVVANMEASLAVPTATSVRAVPAKLLVDNRTVINNHLKRGRGGKASFTHLIGYAMVKALREFPEMNKADPQYNTS